MPTTSQLDHLQPTLLSSSKRILNCRPSDNIMHFHLLLVPGRVNHNKICWKKLFQSKHDLPTEWMPNTPAAVKKQPGISRREGSMGAAVVIMEMVEFSLIRTVRAGGGDGGSPDPQGVTPTTLLRRGGSEAGGGVGGDGGCYKGVEGLGAVSCCVYKNRIRGYGMP